MSEYGTQAEAILAVGKLKGDASKIFCPLMGCECDNRCPCYQDAYFQETTNNSFLVHISCCNNAMFFNTCQYGC